MISVQPMSIEYNSNWTVSADTRFHGPLSGFKRLHLCSRRMLMLESAARHHVDSHWQIRTFFRAAARIWHAAAICFNVAIAFHRQRVHHFDGACYRFAKQQNSPKKDSVYECSPRVLRFQCKKSSSFSWHICTRLVLDFSRILRGAVSHSPIPSSSM